MLCACTGVSFFTLSTSRIHVRAVHKVPYNAAQILSKRPAYRDGKKVEFEEKEPRVPGKHDFSFRLEATKKDGVQTGQTPRPNAPRPPKTESSALRAQTRGGPKTPECSQQAPSTDISQTRRLARAQATSTPS